MNLNVRIYFVCCILCILEICRIRTFQSISGAIMQYMIHIVYDKNW